MTQTILSLFSECADSPLIAQIGATPVISVDMTGQGSVSIHVAPTNYIPRELLQGCEVVIKEKYKLRLVRLLPKYTGVSLNEEILEDEILEMRRRISTVNGSFDGCKWQYDAENSEIIADLKYNNIAILSAKSFEQCFSKLIQDEFGIVVSVKLVCSSAQEAPQPKPSLNTSIDIQPGPFPHSDDIPPWEEPAAEEKPKPKRNKTKQIFGSGFYGLPEGFKPPEIILGKDSGTPVMRISELSQDYLSVCVWGKIFGYGVKEAKSGETLIVSFNITDGTSSCGVKVILPKKNSNSIEKLTNGAEVVVQGDYSFDSYDKEYAIRAKCIAITESVKRADDAPVKRVELHMHTNMSAKDGVSPVEDIIQRAAEWGHKAIAITDHAVAQAYPGAMNQARKCREAGMPIKVIYGVEAYLVNDMVRIVTGRTDMPLSGRFVVFDLETTGLSPSSERITEIGAVYFEDGKITNTFSSFVNPGIPIPPKVTDLTGITDEMVKDAPDESEIIPRFLEFIGENTVMVAHNADFDMGFLGAACARLGLEPPPAYLDTVALSRALYPEAHNHKLDTIAKLLRLPEFNHHRAADDAQTLALILQKELGALRERFGLEQVSEINNKVTGGDIHNIRDSHMIILVKNQAGLKNLYKLISWSHVDNFYRHPRILRSQLERCREGLIFGSACEAGELYRAIIQKRNWGDLCEIAEFYDYLEIQPVSNNEFMLRKDIVRSREEIIEFNKTICKLGEKLGKPVVATCDAHYIDPESDIFRRILLHDRGFDDANHPAQLYLRTTEEMLEEFTYLSKKKAYEIVVENTGKIADMIDVLEPIPAGVYPPTIKGSEEQLRKIATKRAHEIYGDPLPDYVGERLEKELKSIISNGFSVMYVTAQKLVEDSVKHGYLVGSRGSVGSSFAATMAGISEVNPLAPHYICPGCKRFELSEGESVGSGFDLPPKKCPDCGADMNRDGQDIPFETFLGFDGDKQPDIDLNFSGEYQTQAHKFTESLFGKQNVLKAGTIGTVKEKTAYRYVMSFAEANGLVLSKAETERLVRGCVGCKITTGQHPGGMVVVPDYKEIYDFCPYQRPADKTSSDVLTTHFDFHSIHDTILKLDILGHDVPTIYKYLGEYTGIPVTDVPMSDPKVMSLFLSPEALGVTSEDIGAQTGTLSLPELGTQFVRQMLVDTQPKSFADLLQVSGLSHGTDVYLGNAKELIQNGVCTISDVIGTRDNIMTYLIHKGLPNASAFKITEIVRKGGAKKFLTKDLVDLMKHHGVPQWYIDSCFKIKYMFPKAHASAYMIAALRLGWYKVYHPAEYYAAYLTVRSEDFDAQAVLSGAARVRMAMDEIRAKGKDASKTEEDALMTLHISLEALSRGVKFLNVDLFKSDAKKYLVEDGMIRLPFIALKGLGETAAVALAEAAKGGAYISKQDVAARAGVSKTVIETLDAFRVLDGLPDSSQTSLFGN